MQPPRWKMAIVIWLGIYPTATCVFWLLLPYVKDFPLPLKTLCLTLVIVPVMVYVMMPFWTKILRTWLDKDA
jgi:uncharacterized protein